MGAPLTAITDNTLPHVKYLRTRGDKKTIDLFKIAVIHFWNADAIYRQSIARMQDDAIDLKRALYLAREEVALLLEGACQVAKRQHVVVDREVVVPGFFATRINLLHEVLTDSDRSYAERKVIMDTINQICGACNANMRVHYMDLFDPFSWLKSIGLSLLRAPRAMLKSTGMNVDRMEEKVVDKILSP
jgi:hypothetical protein